MKILIVMDPGILIPVKGYGGHERLVQMFAEAYRDMGHEVHLLITGGSVVPGCTVHSLGKEGFPPQKEDARKAILTAWKFLWKHRKDFDLVHNFGRLVYLLPVWNSKVKKIMTYGREISQRNIKYMLKLPNKNVVFTGCSNDLIRRANVPGNWHTVYNAIAFNKYDLTQDLPEDAPFIFLGRIEKVKGCHTAIAVAKATGSRLIIAGNVSPLADEQEYFKKEIEPFVDGDKIKYIGAVNDEQKNEWLGKAKALLFPIEWNEPFGIVMIEAMACGTPVIAYKKGSVDEVITEAVTGFKVEDKKEMETAIKKISLIKRADCREIAKKNFDIQTISQHYLNLYNKN